MTLELQVDVPRTPLFFLKIMHIALSEFKEEVKLSVQHGDRWTYYTACCYKESNVIKKYTTSIKFHNLKYGTNRVSLYTQMSPIWQTFSPHFYFSQIMKQYANTGQGNSPPRPS